MMIINALNGVFVRYVNPADHHSGRIKKSDKEFAKRIDIKKINFSSKN